MDSRKRTYYSIICAVLAIAGILSVISLVHYIELTYGFRTSPSFCNLNERLNCDAVTKSSYNTILGVPVASFGILFYLVSLMLAAGVLYWKYKVPVEKIDAVLFVASLYSCLFSLYLFLVSEILIRVLCPTCMLMYLCNLVFFVCALKICTDSPWKSFLKGIEAAFVSFPRAFFINLERDPLRTRLMHVGVVSFLLIAISVLLLPWGLSLFIMPHKPMSPQETERLIAQWRKETAVSFSFENEGLNRDYRKGNPFAPVVLVEFSDFQCSFCRSLSFNLDELLADFGDQLQIIFKNFPLDSNCNLAMRNSLEKHSCYLAQLVRCAGEQGLFWDAVEYIMSIKEFRDSPRRMDFFREYVRALGLDGVGLKECVDSGRHLQKLRNDAAQGAALGVDRTPTLFINNKKVSSIDRGVLREIIKAAGAK